MDKIEIGYLGFSEKAIEVLCCHDKLRLRAIILPHKRINNNIKELSEKYGISLVALKDKNELKSEMDKHNIKKYIMYEFDWIISKDILMNIEIYNIHPGDLRNNRGAHPIVWSILLGEKMTCLSLYKITHKIDLGELISEYWVNIEEQDTIVSLKRKLEYLGLAYVIDELILYLENKIIPTNITNGNYRRKITKEDYIINVDQDSDEIVIQKINSQYSYKGAIILYKNQQYYVRNFIKKSSKDYISARNISRYLEFYKGEFVYLFEIDV